MGKSNSYYMQLHVEALFTMNEKNELMTIREPWDSTSQPAPRFYLTRPLYEKHILIFVLTYRKNYDIMSYQQIKICGGKI